MKKIKIRKNRISKINIVTIDDVELQFTDSDLSKLAMELESFLEVQASKEDSNSSTKNFWAKMAQE